MTVDRVSGTAPLARDPNVPPLDQLHAAFGVEGTPVRLTGGSVSVSRFGAVVCKRIHQGSLEHPHSFALTQWLCPILRDVPADGFRVARPVPTADGNWMTTDHWTAWTFLEGRPPESADVPACIAATEALHRALHDVRKQPLLDRNTSIFGWADTACWGERPTNVHPLLAPLVDALYALRRPVDGLRSQLIHGDLNRENLLVAPNHPLESSTSPRSGDHPSSRWV